MTQLEMTTSTLAAGSGISSIWPRSHWTFATPALAWFARASCEHLVGHVQAVGDPARTDPPGGEQDVDAAAGAEVEHRLALMQFGDRQRVAAAERREDGAVGDLLVFLAA